MAKKDQEKIAHPILAPDPSLIADQIAYLKQQGLPVCEKCGDQYATGDRGQPICPLLDPTCERNTPDALVAVGD
jgi:hypothetical protein